MQNNLKALRKSKGVTQAKMAEDLGVAVSTVQNWESDRTEMTGYSLLMVADYLGVPASAVFSSEDVEYYYVKLRSDEDELLDLFASCSESGKKRILEYAEMISREYPKNTDDSAGYRAS